MHLKPHQISGAQWLAPKKYALLADQMRVGKTLTALTAAKYTGARRILIACPAIARLNWANAVGSCFGPVRVVTSRGELVAAQDNRAPASVTITSYDLIPEKEERPWDLLIPDESHFLRNHTAARTKRVLAKGGLIHRALRVWALSGTPSVNHAAELWPLLRVYGIYGGGYDQFVREFCTGYMGAYGYVITGSKNQERLRELMRPIFLRRTLAEVAPELDPISFSEFILTGAPIGLPQREVALVEAALGAPDPTAALALVEPAVATLRRLTGVAKVPAVADLIRSELEVDKHKIVVFAVHREVIAALAEALAQFCPVVINGSVPNAERNARVHRFQTDPRCRVFLGNIISAGTAIDLSVADEGVFVESSWVPGENEQAALRIQNIDSTAPKFIRFLSMGGTIDEKIQRVTVRKTADLAAIFDKR